MFLVINVCVSCGQIYDGIFDFNVGLIFFRGGVHVRADRCKVIIGY